MNLIWTSTDTWIAVTGALCAAACALPGCFLVLRKMSMMGDAISHAVLPGLALAFLWTGSRASVPMFLGAAVTGVLTAFLTQWINRLGRVDRGAAMGIVFTTLFALGLILIRQAADEVDLDPGCVLYGALEFVTLDRVALGGWWVPRAALVNGVVFLGNLGLILLFFKEMRLGAFDESLARTLGFHPGFLHYLLMTMVAVTTVAAFESVGSIIVIAMLVVPPATALLLTRRLVWVLVLSVGLGAGAAFLGHLLALVIPPALGFAGTTSSGMMAFATGLLFFVVWLLAPQEGMVAKWRAR
ncbi:MAG: metal ABC transporter permease [Verrucomicrobiales bacterium]